MPEQAESVRATGTAEPKGQVSTPLDETQRWRDFIGPHAERYLQKFRKFTTGSQPRFALTWHWPAFLFGPLWFLYRKMYSYAGTYATCSVILWWYLNHIYHLETIETIASGVLQIGGGVSANYIYYRHVQAHLAWVCEEDAPDRASREQHVQTLRGIAPSIVWLSNVLLFVAFMFLLLTGVANHHQ